MSNEPPLMTLCAVTLDCPDPRALSAFYESATGLASVGGSTDDFAGLRGRDGFFLGFQRVNDYRPPSWPGQITPQQLHLDFEVDDLDAAEKELVRLGADQPAEPAGGDRWRVLLDPDGHPFCITTSKTVRK